MPTQQSRRAGPILGPQKAPNVALRCFLCGDGEAGRRAARNRLSIHVQHEVYPQQCAEFGPGPSEHAGGGSDRFVETLIAWGDPEPIRRSAREHQAAGATRVLIFDFDPRPEFALPPAVAPGRDS